MLDIENLDKFHKNVTIFYMCKMISFTLVNNFIMNILQ